MKAIERIFERLKLYDLNYQHNRTSFFFNLNNWSCVLFVFYHSFSTASSIIMEDSDIQTSSHKSEKMKSYTLKFKLDAISYAEIHGNHAAEKKYKVHRKRIREWRQKKASIQQTVNTKKAKGSQNKTYQGSRKKAVQLKIG